MARIPKWLFVVVPVNLVAIALGVVSLTVLDAKVSATCDNAVSLYFDNDASMRTAAEQLRTDRRLGDVEAETAEQARRRLVRWPGMPDLLYQPDTASAIHFAAKDPSGRIALIGELKKNLKGVRGARPVDCTTEGNRTEAQLDAFHDTLTCSRRLFVSVGNDDELEPVTEILRKDPRVDQIKQVTQEEAYKRVRELAKDDPEFAKIGPEDVGARLDVAARDPAAANSLAAEAKQQLPNVDSVVTLPCFAVPNPVVPAPK